MVLMASEARGLADRLRRARRALGMTQDALARRLKVSTRQVGRWEAGVQQPVGLYADRVERFLREAAS